MNQLLAEKEQKKVDLIFNMAKDVLNNLEIPFTAPYLLDSITKGYLASFSFYIQKDVEENEDMQSLYMDQDAPSNLAIAMLEGLKYYHVKMDITDSPSFGDGLCTLAILEKSEVKAEVNSNGCTIPITTSQVIADLKEALFVTKEQSQLETLQENGEIEFYVVLSRSEYTLEPDYQENKKRKNIQTIAQWFSGVLFGSAFGYSVLSGISHYSLLQWLPLLSILSFGLVISYFLYQLEKNETYSSELLKNVCSNKKKGLSCQEVLSSKGSKLFGFISMTDIGIVYFSTLLLFSIFSLLGQKYANGQNVLFWCAVIPLPYTLFSIYYQLVELKKICVLCMLIQFTLWLQFGSFFLIFNELDVFSITIETAIQVVITGIFVGILYFFYESSRIAKRGLEKETTLKNMMLQDPSIFDLFQQRAQTFNAFNSAPSLMLGNVQAQKKITIILSLTCSPCVNKWKEALKMEDWFGETMSIQIILASNEMFNAFQKEITQFSIRGEKEKGKQLLNSWYDILIKENPSSIENLKELFSKWSSQNLCKWYSEETENAFVDQQSWNKSNPIGYTPTVIYNDREVPQEYNDYNILRGIIDQKLEDEEIIVTAQ
jgi:uncharacterized membrane protein